MSRWIDADAVKEALKQNTPQYMWDEILTTVNIQPYIDLVRCAECKHWERLNYEAPKEGWCDDQMPYSDGRWVDADDFCSYGQRKESE